MIHADFGSYRLLSGARVLEIFASARSTSSGLLHLFLAIDTSASGWTP